MKEEEEGMERAATQRELRLASAPLPAVPPHRVEVEHGGLQLGELDGGDADGPDVAQVVVAALLLHGRHLWSHPAESADDFRSLLGLFNGSRSSAR